MRKGRSSLAPFPNRNVLGSEGINQRNSQFVLAALRAGIVLFSQIADARGKHLGHLEVQPQIIVDPQGRVRFENIGVIGDKHRVAQPRVKAGGRDITGFGFAVVKAIFQIADPQTRLKAQGHIRRVDHAVTRTKAKEGIGFDAASQRRQNDSLK